jgi:Rad3-related DNA helicase
MAKSKRIGRESSALVLIALLAGGCASSPESGSRDRVPLGAEPVTGSEFDAGTHFTPRERSPALADRKVIRSGQLALSLSDLEEARREVERLVAEAGGYVEQSSTTRDSRVFLACRVPADHLDQAMDQIAGLGNEVRRSTSAADVTDQYADLEARLRNHAALRDRLQALLKRATKVEDVLAIEKELNRIQSELDSMQGRLDRMRSQVELSDLSVTIEREVVLGPLGYVGYGVWWAVSKLFVIH